MVIAATAGISPDAFWRLTLGEVLIAIEGYHERERQSLISRISAILRALSKKGDPFKGLKVGSANRKPSLASAVRHWIFASDE